MSGTNPKTVLVIGAGGSNDCGFPLGTTLIDQIITEHTHPDKKGYFTSSIRRILFHARKFIADNNLKDCLPPSVVKVLYSNQPQEIMGSPGIDLFTNWVQPLNVYRSIDEFISYNRQYSIFAKLSILLILSQKESPQFFDNREFQDKQGVKYFGPQRTWYNALWGNLTKNGPTFDQLKEILATLHIVTFNYDRSLDYFLFNAIKKYYPESEKSYTDLPITHVYGSLGSLNKGDDLYNPYVALKYRIHETIPSGFAMSSYGNELLPSESQWEAYDLHLFKLANSIETYGNIFPMKKAEKIQNMILQAKNTYCDVIVFA